MKNFFKLFTICALSIKAFGCDTPPVNRFARPTGPIRTLSIEENPRFVTTVEPQETTVINHQGFQVTLQRTTPNRMNIAWAQIIQIPQRQKPACFINDHNLQEHTSILTALGSWEIDWLADNQTPISCETRYRSATNADVSISQADQVTQFTINIVNPTNAGIRVSHRPFPKTIPSTPNIIVTDESFK